MELKNVRNIPIIGRNIYNVGQAVRVMSQPCGPDPWIAVQAAFTYAPALVWSLVKPEPMDFLTTRFGRGHSTRRRRRFGAHSVWRPNWTEAIHGPGTKLPVAPGLTTAMWRGAMLAERVGWYLLVVDATSEFLVNWTSMTWQWSGCKVPGASWASLSGNPEKRAFSMKPNRTQLVAPHHQSHGSGRAGLYTVRILETGPKTFNGSARCGVSERFGYDGSVSRVYWQRVINNRDVETVEARRGREDVPAGTWSVQESIFNTSLGPTAWHGWVEWTGGELQIFGVSAYASGAPGHGLEPDP